MTVRQRPSLLLSTTGASTVRDDENIDGDDADDDADDYCDCFCFCL